MPAPKKRQCPRCGLLRPRKEKQCGSCGTWLVQRRFRMTPGRVKLVHVLARQKGLDRELYKLRLQAVGVESCKELKRGTFKQFVDGLKKLPDVRVLG